MVFVPAIMGAGMVFSVAALTRDIVSQGSRTMQARRARLRGHMVAEVVANPDHPALGSAADADRPAAFVVAGSVSTIAGVYVLVRSAGNLLGQDAVVRDVAWLWGGGLVVGLAALGFAATCFAMARDAERPPPWVWSILVPTPLLAAHEVPRSGRDRLVVAVAVSTVATLTVLATWPRSLDGFDRSFTRLVDESGLEGIDSLGDLVGSTRSSMVAAVLVGIATLRCRRFAWLFVSSVVISLAATQVLRTVVDRPRPPAGPMAGATDSFPSGHLVQATLLAWLVPLAVYELTRSDLLSRIVAVGLALGLALVAIERIANVRHEPTDVIAGIALGTAVGGWARLALVLPGSHAGCRSCAVTVRRMRAEREAAGHG